MKETLLGLMAVVLTISVLVGGGYWWGSDSKDSEWSLKWTKRDKSDLEAEKAAKKSADEKEAQLQATQSAGLKAYQQGVADAENKAKGTIAAYRAGHIRLQKRFECISASVGDMPVTPTSGQLTDAARDCGFSDADVGFLISIAERADKLVEKVTALQKVVTEDRRIINDTTHQ
ncbi:lysis protein [Yersinia massiliensis]|uniref:lysis protein n=1 Tax=Yersinia massiliensis TaxID=419257 RepID=UPI0021BDB161|nr:lysis protein [Yersinia massiliensis]